MPAFNMGTYGSFGVTTSTDQTIVAQKTFMVGSVAQVPVRVRAMVGQTGSLTEWQDSAGAVMSGVGNTGFIYAGAPQTTFMSAVNGRIQAHALLPGVVALTAKGAASQTANLQEWHNSAGAVMASINAVGAGFFGQQNNAAIGVGSAAAGYSQNNRPGIVFTNTTSPSSNVAGGGFLYTEGGILKYRGELGTTTVLGAA